MIIKKINSKKILISIVAVVVVYVIFRFFVVAFYSCCAPSPPRDPCDHYRDIKEETQCCDDYQGFQEGFELKEIKDECYWRRIYNNRCDFKSDLYRIKDPDEGERDHLFYDGICNKIINEKKQVSCLDMIEKNLACYTSDIKYCTSDGYLCLAVLGNNEDTCLKLSSADSRIDCLKTVKRANDRYDKKICDLWQEQLQKLDQDFWNRSFYETEINWCYMEAGSIGKDREACYQVKEGEAWRDFCFQEAAKD